MNIAPNTHLDDNDWILVVQACPRSVDGHPGALGFSIASATLGSTSPGSPSSYPAPASLTSPNARASARPRAVIIEARDRNDDIEALLRLLGESGIGATVPTLLVAPLAVVRHHAHVAVDDFVVSPCTSDELSERIRRIEQRRPDAQPARLHVGGLEVDVASHEVTVEGRRVSLTRLEFELLSFLVQHPGQVFTRAELLSHVWRHDGPVTGRTVDIHVRRLRAKLGAGADPLETVRKVGYRFLPRPAPALPRASLATLALSPARNAPELLHALAG